MRLVWPRARFCLPIFLLISFSPPLSFPLPFSPLIGSCSEARIAQGPSSTATIWVQAVQNPSGWSRNTTHKVSWACSQGKMLLSICKIRHGYLSCVEVLCSECWCASQLSGWHRGMCVCVCVCVFELAAGKVYLCQLWLSLCVSVYACPIISVCLLLMSGVTE